MAPTTRGLQEEEYDIVRSWKKKSRSGQLTLHTKGSVAATKQQEREDFRKQSVGKTRRRRDRQEDFRKRGRDRQEDFRKRSVRKTSQKRNRGTQTARRQLRASRRRRTQTKRRQTLSSDSAKQRWAWTETSEQSPHKLVGGCRVGRVLDRQAANVEGRPNRWYISV